MMISIFLVFAAILNLFLLGGIILYAADRNVVIDIIKWKKEVLCNKRYGIYALLNVFILLIGGPLLFQNSFSSNFFIKKALLTIIFILLSDLLVFLLELLKSNLLTKKKWIIRIGSILLFVFILEIYAFNMHYFSSMDFKEKDLSHNYVTGNGLLLAGDNYEILKSGDKTIEILGINEKVNNMYVDMEIVEPVYTQNTKIDVKFSITDEANELYNRITNRTIVQNVEATKYLNFNLSGVSEKIKLELNTDGDKILRINAIKINVNRPFSFSVIRFFVLSAAMILWTILKKSSGLYRFAYTDSKNQYLITAGVVLALMLLFTLFLTWNPINLNTNITHHKQYQALARSLINGQLSLDKEVPDSLKQLSNPYDTNYRAQEMKKAGEYAEWDTAYYNGKYYVYFGVVPVILLYMPYYFITGQDMQNFLAVFLFVIPSIAAVFGLISQIIKKWFPKTPFLVYLMLSVMATLGGGFVFLITHADLYAIPIAGGLLFTVTGLYCWMKADEKEYLSKKFLLMGSLCMALVAGCRPQLLLFSFLAIPLFSKHVFKERTLLSKKSIKETICFCFPFIVIAVLIMVYNYARFGSITDFGANYNLTTNDMTKRGFVPGRTGLAIFTYMFQPPNIVARFPFLIAANFENSYLGVTIRESTFGGIFTTNLILVIIFFVTKFKDILKKKKVYAFTLLLIGIGLLLPIVDAQMAGLLQRYFSDFALALFLGATIIILAIFEEKEKYPLNYVIPLFQCSFALSVLYNILTVFTRGSRTLMEGNPEIYFKIYHAVSFWL